MRAALIDKALKLPEILLDKFRPLKPYDFLKAQPPPLATFLPYESVLELERSVVILSDGSLGVLWELEPIAHEVLDDESLARQAIGLADVFDKVRDIGVAFQVIHDAEPSSEFEVPEVLKEPFGAAAKVMAERVRFIQSLALEPKDRLRLMRRRVYLSLRCEGMGIPTKLLASKQFAGEQVTQWLETAVRRILKLATEVEYGLSHAQIKAQALDAKGLMTILRQSFHDSKLLQESALLAEEVPHNDQRLSAQILRDFVALSPHAIKVGGDSWELASWLEQPPVSYQGMWARLLEIDVPHRLVVNIRACQDVQDLSIKSSMLKHATDPFGELQREEIRSTQDAMARGEALSFVSMHLMVRNVGLSPESLEEFGAARMVVSQLKTLTQIPFVVEKYAAPALFLTALPLGFSAEAASYSGREKRVLARHLAPYLPIFGPFKGTKTPMQLMVSRGGAASWLNPFDSETSSHMAGLASSGGGKSFWMQNMMTSFLAKYDRATKAPLLFVIDKKTSYEIFTRVMGEDLGYDLIKPPEQYPNIFRGKLDEFRLPVIVGLLKTAASLVSPNATLGAIEEMLLSEAVSQAFAQSELDASTEYNNGELRSTMRQLVRIPILSDVIDNLYPIAAAAGISSEVVSSLAQSLSPFVRSGPYAALFDREEFERFEADSPGVNLYDIDAVASNPVLSTLTTQMILSEILRQIRRPENRGRPGMLVIEEAGVISGSSPEIVAFIQDAWKTFRKLGFACVGITNEVDDFAQKPGPREIWNVSPNKVILKMLDKDLDKALVSRAGIPPLIDDAHIGSLIRSLTKKDGAFSQGLWWSDEVKGSFVFHPTGYDYWLAASKPIEVETVYQVKKTLGLGFWQAVSALAKSYPRGVRAKDGSIRGLTSEELQTLCGD